MPTTTPNRVRFNDDLGAGPGGCGAKAFVQASAFWSYTRHHPGMCEPGCWAVQLVARDGGSFDRGRSVQAVVDDFGSLVPVEV